MSDSHEQRRNRQGKKSLPLVDMDAELKRSRRRSASASASTTKTEHWIEDMAEPDLHEEGEGEASRCWSAA